MWVKEVQFAKASPSMGVNSSGHVAEVREMHSPKAASPHAFETTRQADGGQGRATQKGAMSNGLEPVSDGGGG